MVSLLKDGVESERTDLKQIETRMSELLASGGEQSILVCWGKQAGGCWEGGFSSSGGGGSSSSSKKNGAKFFSPENLVGHYGIPDREFRTMIEELLLPVLTVAHPEIGGGKSEKSSEGKNPPVQSKQAIQVCCVLFHKKGSFLFNKKSVEQKYGPPHRIVCAAPLLRSSRTANRRVL